MYKRHTNGRSLNNIERYMVGICSEALSFFSEYTYFLFAVMIRLDETCQHFTHNPETANKRHTNGRSLKNIELYMVGTCICSEALSFFSEYTYFLFALMIRLDETCQHFTHNPEPTNMTENNKCR